MTLRWLFGFCLKDGKIFNQPCYRKKENTNGSVHQSLHEYLTRYVRGTKFSGCDARECLRVLHLMLSIKGGEAQGESWHAAQESFGALIC